MNNIKNQRQDEAIVEYVGNDYVGTVMAVPAFGKTWVFFKALYAALEGGKVNTTSEKWFWAETNERLRDLERESLLFEKVYGKNPMKDFIIKFKTYQSKAEGYRDFDCYDEVDLALSQVFSNCFRTSTAICKLGLTATCEATNTVFKSKVSELLHGEIRQADDATKSGVITDTINKGQMLEVVCPVVYTYSTSQAIEDGLVTPFKTYIVEHQLDAVKRNVKPWKTKTYMLTERAAYDQWNALRTSPTNISAIVRKLCGNNMTRLLWDAESKIKVAKALLSQLEGKTIVFGLSLKFVQQITPNTVVPDSKKDYVVMFNNGEITSIGTVKKLERGITLTGVDNIILVSWHSTATSFLQRLGRGLRPSPGKEYCNLYLFKTSNSFEAGRWFEKINKILDDKGNVIEEIDLNIQGYMSSNEIMRNQKS